MIERTYKRGNETMVFNVPECTAQLSGHDAYVCWKTLKGIPVYLGAYSRELETVLSHLGYRLRERPDGSSVPEARPSNDHVMPWVIGRRLTFSYIGEQNKFLQALRNPSRSYHGNTTTGYVYNLGDALVGYTSIVNVDDAYIRDALKRAGVTAMSDGVVWGLDTTL